MNQYDRQINDLKQREKELYRLIDSLKQRDKALERDKASASRLGDDRMKRQIDEQQREIRREVDRRGADIKSVGRQMNEVRQQARRAS